MARPPSLVLKREDYDEVEGDWIDRLIRSLNTFGKQTNTALSGGLTFGENGSAFLKTLDIPADVSAKKPVKFANSLASKGNPAGILVIAAKSEDGTPISLGNPAWKLISGSEIAIHGFSGLSGKANVTLLVLGG